MIRAGPKSPGFDQAQVLPEFTRQATSYILQTASAAKPFFLYLAMNSSHTPVEPLPQFVGRSGAGIYGDFVTQTDHSVGEIMSALTKSGVITNTLVIFTSDNGSSPAGFPLEDERQFGHATSHIYRGRKSDAWEGGHRVPFLASWPSRIGPMSNCAQTISLTDLMATIADIRGYTLPAGAGEDSTSIVPALLGQKPGLPADRILIQHSIEGVFAIRQGPWKYIECRGSGGWGMSEKQASAQGLPVVQLYNLSDDPGEKRNLQASHPEVRDRLKKLLDSARSGDGTAAGFRH